MRRTAPVSRGGSPSVPAAPAAGTPVTPATDPPAAPAAGGSVDGSLAALRAAVQRLHREAGEPSTRELAKRAGTISHSTVNTVLRCLKTPAWAHLELVVDALGGEPEEFRRLWTALRNIEKAEPDDETALAIARTAAVTSFRPIRELVATLVSHTGRAGTPPILCLLGPEDERTPVHVLAELFQAEGRWVPHVLVDTRDTDAVTQLAEAAHGLARRAPHRTPLRFPRFAAAGPHEVDAFLRDLSDQYLRRPWRPAAWRRTARPVLLLDGDGGDALLQMIAESRTRTGRDDPLLVVAAGRAVPPDAGDCWVVPPNELDGMYRLWTEAWPAARARGDRSAGYLAVGVRPVGDHPALFDRMPRIAARPVPLLARTRTQAVLAAVLAVVLVVLAFPAALGAYREIGAGCFVPLWSSAATDVVRSASGQCVGFSAEAGPRFGDDPRLDTLMEKVFAANRAVRGWPSNRVLTVVFLASLTNASGSSPAVVREGLAGVAAAQHRANSEAATEPLSPYVRVVIANAGLTAADNRRGAEMLASYAERDRTVNAVIASLDSTVTSRAMLQTLDAAGLMIVAPTMTADGIGAGLLHYLQLSPPNIEQARLIRHYVTQVLHRQTVVNFYNVATAAGDLYVDTLRSGLAGQFGSGYQEAPWQPGSPMTDICSDRYGGVVVYSGRPGDLSAFANQITLDCAGRVPKVVLSEAVLRYLSDADGSSRLPGIPAAVLSAGTSANCAPPTAAGEAFRRDMDYLRLPCSQGRAALYYDGTLVTVRAAQSLTGATGSVRPGASQIYSRIRYDTDRQPYQGASGRLSFDRTGAPVGRTPTVLCVADLSRAATTPPVAPGPTRACPD